MEELLATQLAVIRGLVPTWENDPVQIARLWGRGYFPSGTRYKSVELALASQAQAGFAGRLLQGAEGDFTLNKWDYGVNPALPAQYRYTVRITCTNPDNKIKYKSALILNEPIELSSGEIFEAAKTRIDLIKEGDVSPWFADLVTSKLVCEYEIVAAEIRS